MYSILARLEAGAIPDFSKKKNSLVLVLFLIRWSTELVFDEL